MARNRCTDVSTKVSNQSTRGISVSTTAIDQVRSNARWLERREADRTGSIEFARASIARESGITLSSWRNLVRGRLKRIDVWMRDRLQALVIRELEQEIRRLNHELETAKRCGAHLASEHISAIEAHLSAAQAIITGDHHVVDNGRHGKTDAPLAEV